MLTTDIRIDYNDAGERKERSKLRSWSTCRPGSLPSSQRSKNQHLEHRGHTNRATSNTNYPSLRRSGLGLSSSDSPWKNFSSIILKLRLSENRNSSLPWWSTTTYPTRIELRRLPYGKAIRKSIAPAQLQVTTAEHCWPQPLTTAHCIEA